MLSKTSDMPKANSTTSLKGRRHRKAPRPPSPPSDDRDIEHVEVLQENSHLSTSKDMPHCSTMPPNDPSQSNKSKKSCHLRDEIEEEQVLEWVSEHPSFLNLKKNKDYKNKAVKDRLWEEKADELKYDGK